MGETGLRSGDAFQLGYLPHLVRAQFDALELLIDAREGADGALAGRVEKMLQGLPLRGPEVVSCVFQLEALLVERLRAQPIKEPESAAQCDTFIQGVAAAFAACPDAAADGRRLAYELGARVGEAETLLALASRLWALWSTAPAHARLTARATELRRRLAAWIGAPAPAIDCANLKEEDGAVAQLVAQAAAIAGPPPTDRGMIDLGLARLRVEQSARALEADAWGTPRQAVRAWREQKLDGATLMRRLAEHHRWNVPCRVGADGKPAPLVFTFDKRVLFAFSDRPALAARPAFIRSDKPDEQQCITCAGALLFSRLPEDVDVLVIDASDDPGAPQTINYPRSLHAQLRQLGAEVALELAACDWSELGLPSLRAYRFWIVASGGQVHNLLAPDPFGRPFVALFSSQAALEAHLARATPEQKTQMESWQRLLLPGETLFPELAKLGIGVVLNPSGPGRTRRFNRATVAQLAAPPPPPPPR